MKPGCYKYIRLSNDKVKFISIYQDHSSAVNPEEVPISAGMIMISEDEYFKLEGYSMTLKLGRKEDDADLISSILQIPNKPS